MDAVIGRWAGRRQLAGRLRAAFLVITLATTLHAWSAPATDRIQAVDVVGTRFHITLASGKVLAGQDLQGATLSLKLPGHDRPSQIRLDNIRPAAKDEDVLLHEMSVLDSGSGRVTPLCAADANGERWSFPLQGQWSESGERVSDKGLTLVCAAGGALGKCVGWGYKPWATLPDGSSLAAYHQACVRMVRADYCGNGLATTRDGMMVDVADRAGVLRFDDAGAAASGLAFEAAWTPSGALCVARTRVPENISLDGLARTCPGLKGHLGTEHCVESSALQGGYGAALLFSRVR